MGRFYSVKQEKKGNLIFKHDSTTSIIHQVILI